MLQFTRHLIRNTVSDDAICLALYAAAEDVGASVEEARIMLRAVLNEKRQHGVWPKGF